MGRIPEASPRTKDRDGAAILGWTGDNGDPDNFLDTLLGCEAVGGNNRAQWCNQGIRRPREEGQEDVSDQSQSAPSSTKKHSSSSRRKHLGRPSTTRLAVRSDERQGRVRLYVQRSGRRLHRFEWLLISPSNYRLTTIYAAGRDAFPAAFSYETA
jgi:hypothetical protein